MKPIVLLKTKRTVLGLCLTSLELGVRFHTLQLDKNTKVRFLTFSIPFLYFNLTWTKP